jgi:hypothetical protein
MQDSKPRQFINNNYNLMHKTHNISVNFTIKYITTYITNAKQTITENLTSYKVRIYQINMTLCPPTNMKDYGHLFIEVLILPTMIYCLTSENVSRDGLFNFKKLFVLTLSRIL